MKKYNTPMTEVMKVESGAFLMGTGEGSIPMQQAGVRMDRVNISYIGWD